MYFTMINDNEVIGPFVFELKWIRLINFDRDEAAECLWINGKRKIDGQNEAFLVEMDVGDVNDQIRRLLCEG